MPAKPDRTFAAESLYGSNEWVSLRLGMAKDTWFRKRGCLYERGFPKPDKDTGLYLKADVDAWISRQSRFDDGRAMVSGPRGVRIDAI